jgi:predicted DNA-binding protein
MPQVNTQMTDQLSRQIDKIAKSMGRTRAQFVRDAAYTVALRIVEGEMLEVDIAPQVATGMGWDHDEARMLVRGRSGYLWVRVDPATGFVVAEDRHIGK